MLEQAELEAWNLPKIQEAAREKRKQLGIVRRRAASDPRRIAIEDASNASKALTSMLLRLRKSAAVAGESELAELDRAKRDWIHSTRNGSMCG